MVSRERREGRGGERGVPSRSHRSRSVKTPLPSAQPDGLRKGEDVSVVPADASTATTERCEGVRRAARRGMPSGRGLSVVVCSSPFSSNIDDIVSLTTTSLSPPLHHDLSLTLHPFSLLLSSSVTFTSTPLCPTRSEHFTRLSASPQHRLRLSPNAPVYYHPACTVFSSGPFTTETEPVESPRRLLYYSSR